MVTNTKTIMRQDGDVWNRAISYPDLWNKGPLTKLKMFTIYITNNLWNLKTVYKDAFISVMHFLVRYSARTVNVFVFSASAQQGGVESGTRRKVKRQLSFQRYCHASRLLRGVMPNTPGSLHLLDKNYLGQAAVRTHLQKTIADVWIYQV